MNSWWGHRLADAMAELIEHGRLSRGRALARTGCVLSRHVAAGRVTGAVQGSAARPYAVSFLLTPLIDADAARVAALLAERPELLAALVAGELPTELGEPQHGLFPRFVDELDFECTCPDWGWPCKHAAALVHVLVEDVDARPQTLLALRGVEVDPLLGVETPVDDEAALADSLPAYWSPRAALVPPPVRFRPAIDELDEGLLRSALRCAGGGSAADEDAVAWLRDCYRRLG
jgi:uncharacterized Zn finger protein